MTTAPSRRPIRRLRPVSGAKASLPVNPDLIYRSLVLVILGCIAHALAKPSTLDRCIRNRYEQVLESHQLTDQQITEAIRTSEFTKATNFCNGGSGRLNWNS